MIDSGWVSVGIVAVTSIAGAGITIGMVRQGQKDFAARLELIADSVDRKLSIDVHAEVVKRIDGEIAGVRSDVTGVRGEVGSLRGDVSSVRHSVRNLEQSRMPLPRRG